MVDISPKDNYAYVHFTLPRIFLIHVHLKLTTINILCPNCDELYKLKGETCFGSYKNGFKD